MSPRAAQVGSCRPIAPRRSNGAATAGFVLGLLPFLISLILLMPIIGWIIYITMSLLGFILSIVGLTRVRETGTGAGFAVAGIILSIL